MSRQEASPCVLAVVLAILCLPGCGIDVPDGGIVAEPFWVDAGVSGVDAGGTGDSGSDGSAGDAVGGDSGGNPVLEGDSGTEVSGTTEFYAFWRQSRVLSHNAAPFGEEWQLSKTTTVGLMKVDWSGDVGQLWTVPCGLHTNEVASSQLSYPASFVNVLTTGPTPISRTGLTLTQPSQTQWVGLTSGYSGAMPGVGEATHPAVVDADQDGHPGITLFINMPFFGDQAIYAVQRNASSWTGTLTAEGSLVAFPLTVTEQVTVGATNDILVAATESKPAPGMEPEELRMFLTTGTVGCAALLANPPAFVQTTWP